MQFLRRTAGVHAILGAILGGGKGFAIGAVIGAGVVAGVQATTKGTQVRLPAESLLRLDAIALISKTVNSDQLSES